MRHSLRLGCISSFSTELPILWWSWELSLDGFLVCKKSLPPHNNCTSTSNPDGGVFQLFQRVVTLLVVANVKLQPRRSWQNSRRRSKIATFQTRWSYECPLPSQEQAPPLISKTLVLPTSTKDGGCTAATWHCHPHRVGSLKLVGRGNNWKETHIFVGWPAIWKRGSHYINQCSKFKGSGEQNDTSTNKQL